MSNGSTRGDGCGVDGGTFIVSKRRKPRLASLEVLEQVVEIVVLFWPTQLLYHPRCRVYGQDPFRS